jgi:delta-1-pyrroline-5-carboxylate synthetase
VDAKVDYPAACNAVEKILVHRVHEQSGGIFRLQSALREAGATVHGTESTMQLLGAPEAPSLRHEYGTPDVTVDIVDSMEEAIEKIHKYGSGHTEVCSSKNSLFYVLESHVLAVLGNPVFSALQEFHSTG